MGIVIHSSAQIDDFGRRVLRLLEAELTKLNTAGLMITIVQTGDNPHPVITVIHQKITRSFQIDAEEIALGTSDAELSEKIWMRLVETIGDLPAPNKAYCCAHKPSCAVHQPPHDAEYVHCSCTEVAGRPRHSWSPSDLQFVRALDQEN